MRSVSCVKVFSEINILNTKGEKMFISELIRNDIEMWKGGDVVLVDAPTGSGKTTAVLTEMRNEAMGRGKEILYIANRKILRRQIQAILGEEIGYAADEDSLFEIERFSGIAISSYQKIQYFAKNNIPIALEDFCYIVFDEFQYILSDAMFQAEIYYFIKWLDSCNRLKSKTLILISATPDESFEFLINKTRLFGRCKENLFTESFIVNEYCKISSLYEQPIYNKYRGRKLWKYKVPRSSEVYLPHFFEDERSVVELIKKDCSDEKWLIFIGQKKLGKEICEKLQGALGENAVAFLSAEEVEIENGVMQEIVDKQKFSAKVLITTKVLENGVSLHDDRLRNVVLSTIWHDEFMQMLGRKRFGSGEKINVFMCKKNLNSFNGIRNKILLPLYLCTKVHPADRAEMILHNSDYYHFARRMLVYDKQFESYRINPTAKYVLKKKMDFVDGIMDKLKVDDMAFIKEQLRWIGINDNLPKLTLEQQKYLQNETIFVEYIDEKRGRDMNKAAQMELRSCFYKLLGPKLQLKRKLPGLFIINSYLRQWTDFAIVTKTCKSGTVWRIEKNEE